MARKDIKRHPDLDSAANYTIETELEAWGTNSTLTSKYVTLEMTAFDLQSKNNWTHVWKVNAELHPNQSTELWKGLVPGQPIRNNVADVPKDIVVSGKLLDENGTILARYTNW